MTTDNSPPTSIIWLPSATPSKRPDLPLSPNPPKDTDRRDVRRIEAEGGEGATGEIAWAHLHRRTGAPMAVCLRCAGWRGISSGAESAGIFGCPVGGSPRCRQAGSGIGSQPGQGAAELSAQGRSGRCRVRAERVSRPAEEPPPEGLGGGYPLSQTDPLPSSGPGCGP